VETFSTSCVVGFCVFFSFVYYYGPFRIPFPNERNRTGRI
jgi:hypothetical protein